MRSELSPLEGARTPTDLADVVELVVGDRRLTFRWGQIHQLGTAAYWIDQTVRLGEPTSYRLGRTLAEEVAACILGGHGIPAVVGLAAFERLRDHGLLSPPGDRDAIHAAMHEPLGVPGRVRPIKYRFATQRADRVASALSRLYDHEAPEEPHDLREFLLGFAGVGPKTASWIVRNWTGSDAVAIIDIHVQRAGVAAGFFLAEWQLPRDYAHFERAFCSIARLGGVSPAALDACIWDQMQALGRAQSVMLNTGYQQAA